MDDYRRNKDYDPNYPTFSSRYAASFKNKITNLLQKQMYEGICEGPLYYSSFWLVIQYSEWKCKMIISYDKII